MKTAKERFSGVDGPEQNRWMSDGLERMVRREIADQVERVLRNI